MISAHFNLCLQSPSDSPALASKVAGMTSLLPHLANFCVFCRDGFYHICQTGLEFLASSNLPTPASQSAGITGVSHYTQPELFILFFLFIYLFWDSVSFCHPGWSTVVWSRFTATSASRVQAISASASWVVGITGACHHTWLIFLALLIETGFHHIGQACLELLNLWLTHLGLPKCWDYRCEPPHPAHFLFF